MRRHIATISATLAVGLTGCGAVNESYTSNPMVLVDALAKNPFGTDLAKPSRCTAYRGSVPMTKWRYVELNDANITALSDVELMREFINLNEGCNLDTPKGILVGAEVTRRKLIEPKDLPTIANTTAVPNGTKQIILEALLGDDYDKKVVYKDGTNYIVYTYSRDFRCGETYIVNNHVVVGSNVTFCYKDGTTYHQKYGVQM